MARMRPLAKDEVSDEIRAMLEAGERWLGESPLSTGIQARNPEILFASSALGAAPAKSGLLDPQLRALVCLRAAEMIGCPF
jgi:alkylhydroperoxidase family enzyme